jgi:hypothetical protein
LVFGIFGTLFLVVLKLLLLPLIILIFLLNPFC